MDHHSREDMVDHHSREGMVDLRSKVMAGLHSRAVMEDLLRGTVGLLLSRADMEVHLSKVDILHKEGSMDSRRRDSVRLSNREGILVRASMVLLRSRLGIRGIEMIRLRDQGVCMHWRLEIRRL